MMVGVHTSKNNPKGPINNILDPAVLLLLISIITIVGAFSISGLKTHFR